MSDNFKKGIIQEELEKGEKELFVIELKEHFWQNRVATAKSGKQQLEANLSQVTGIRRDQEEWVAFLKQQLKNEK